MMIPNGSFNWGSKTVIQQQETQLQSTQLVQLQEWATHVEKNKLHSLWNVWCDGGKRPFGIIGHRILELEYKSENKKMIH